MENVVHRRRFLVQLGNASVATASVSLWAASHAAPAREYPRRFQITRRLCKPCSSSAL